MTENEELIDLCVNGAWNAVFAVVFLEHSFFPPRHVQATKNASMIPGLKLKLISRFRFLNESTRLEIINLLCFLLVQKRSISALLEGILLGFCYLLHHTSASQSLPNSRFLVSCLSLLERLPINIWGGTLNLGSVVTSVVPIRSTTVYPEGSTDSCLSFTWQKLTRQNAFSVA
jgi:hypothetical protein